MAKRREDRQKRREGVLQAALEVIVERGLANTRMTDIAKRAGMSPGNILYYFESKDDLLMDLLRWSEDLLLRQANEEFDRLPSYADRLQRLTELAAPAGPSDPGWILWLEVWSLSPHDERIGRGHADLDRRWVGTLADLVRSGQEAGEFSPDIDPKDFAVRYGAMMDGLAIKVVAGIDGMDVARLLEACSATAVRELGLRVPRRPRKRTRAVP
ncbi:MAG: TetR/AcrR family transcriptional regulator [Actinomycetota bacterium]